MFLPFKKLSPWQRNAFSAALLERMLPNYQMFSQAVEFGDYALLRNQLNLLWQMLGDKKVKINREAQLTKLEAQIPDPNHYDFFGVYPALDAVMALSALLQGGEDSGVEHIEQVSQLSLNSVNAYVELTLSQQQDEILPADIEQHPLMVWEVATQQELFDYLLTAKENKQTCQQLKNIVLEEGLSNLGIEIS